MMDRRKIKMSPIIIVICTVLIIAASLITIFAVSKHDSEDNKFRSTAKSAMAVCLDKEAYTETEENGSVTYYQVLIEYDAGHGSVRTQLTSDDPAYDSINVNSQVEVLYQPDEPLNCRPEFTFPHRAGLYIFLGVLSAIAFVVMVLNIITIIRNIHGYQPAYERPDDIGTFGDIGADSGLGDKDRDYSGTNPANDKLMDSYSDPFATYTGYDEGGSPEQISGEYFDPNAGYSEMPAPDNDIPGEEYDLNNPFVSPDAGQTPFGGTGNYNMDYSLRPDDPAYNDTSLTNATGEQFGERVEQDPDDLFMRGNMNDPFVPPGNQDPFRGN